jgi:hypothetical protein
MAAATPRCGNKCGRDYLVFIEAEKLSINPLISIHGSTL